MHSIWESGHFHRHPQVVVVGGGIVGLFTALHLKRARPRYHVLVLERGPFPCGASMRNAGFATFGSPSELLADEEREGRDVMLARVEERWRGLLELRAELGDEAIGYEATGGHEVFALQERLYTRVAAGLDRLNDELRPIMGTTVFRWDDAAAARLGMAMGLRVVRTDLEGALDSGALMAALLAKVQGEGVLVRGSAAVAGLEGSDDAVRITLTDGSRIAAGQAVVATNGYTRDLLPHTGIAPARGQVLCTGPVPGLKLRGTFHAREGYLYFRDLHGAVLIGGGRDLDPAGECTTADGTTPTIQAHLEDYLRQVVLPGTPFSVVRRWSGVMGFPASGKNPVVARLGGRLVVAAGLSGMGVAIGIRVARRAAALVLEEDPARY